MNTDSKGIPDANEAVLSTLNVDGSRRWIRPKIFMGRYWKRRAFVAYGLIALFAALPYIRINGKPAMLFDIPAREFTFFGTTFLPTETMLLMLLLIGIFGGIFLLTAVAGRVWCGWGCPQTVYLEFLYRPIEQLIEGGRGGQLKLDRGQGQAWRRVVKYVVFLFLSAFIAHIFLAYFVGVEQLAQWIRMPPTEHPVAFLVMAGTTALMFFDFAYFREQTCIVACPYGRFQSVLLDRRSLIVGYDEKRGEPRGKLGARKKKGEEGFGDCVDCNFCVAACPTGIDIRQGLQMECVHCTQCIDACDEMMDRVGKPRGLIRYSSQDGLERVESGRFRPRLVLYPLVLAIVFGMLTYSLATRTSADVTLLRGLGLPYTTLEEGRVVSNQLRVKIINRSDEARSYHFELVELPEATLVAPENPLDVGPGESRTTALFVNAPASLFPTGKIDIALRVYDGVDYDEKIAHRLLGPYVRAGQPGAPEPAPPEEASP